MVDSEIEEFARVLVEHSARVEKGDNVYLIAESLEALPLFKEVRRQVIQKGAHPHEHLLYDSQVGTGMDYDLIQNSSMEQLETMSEAKMEEMKRMDAYIRIGGGDNMQELTGVDGEKIAARRTATRPIVDERLEKRWVATRYPTTSLAQNAEMPTQEFRQILLDSVTGIDWDELKRRNMRIKEVFDQAKEVRIVSSGTDVTLSLEGREGVSAHGRRNVPDGEVFYAPVHTSLRGNIEFTYPAPSSGTEVHGIKLEFGEDGRIKSFSAEKNEDYLEKMINTDDGSHYIGEFGIGTNRKITTNMRNTLLDEKIGGSIHLAIGNAYSRTVPEDDPHGRNSSGIHWDIVKDLRKEADRGKILVDGEKVFEDGEWLFEE